MTQLDVAVVGDNTIDHFLDEPHLGDLVGGNALNVAVQLAMMGFRVGYFGAVGDDANGELVREATATRGVDLAGLVVMSGRTALSQIRRDTNGDRRFESEDFGVTAEYYPDQSALRTIAAAGWVHVGMLPQSMRLGAELSALGATRLSQDCSVSPEWHQLSVLFASAGESDEAAAHIVHESLALGAEIAVATLGSRGACAGQGSRRWHTPALPTNVVDTTGAGDAFMAGFIAAQLSGAGIAESLFSGSVRGSFACQFAGGWPQLPLDIQRFG